MTEIEIKQIAEAVAEMLFNNVLLQQKEVLSMSEAALYTGISKSTLYKLTCNRMIPHYKPTGKMCFFKREELEEWLVANPVATAEDIAIQANRYCMRNKANI